MPDIYHILQKLNIQYEKVEHPAVFTVEESSKYEIESDAAKTKNLFLQNKNKSSYYLVVVEGAKRLDLKKMSTSLNESKLNFASPEKLKEHLGLTPGSVSPFGLINNTSKTVKVVVDKDLTEYDKLGFHPNINTSTLIITSEDFKKFTDWSGHETIYLEI